jgi:hypothetical protein
MVQPEIDLAYVIKQKSTMNAHVQVILLLPKLNLTQMCCLLENLSITLMVRYTYQRFIMSLEEEEQISKVITSFLQLGDNLL